MAIILANKNWISFSFSNIANAKSLISARDLAAYVWWVYHIINLHTDDSNFLMLAAVADEDDGVVFYDETKE